MRITAYFAFIATTKMIQSNDAHPNAPPKYRRCITLHPGIESGYSSFYGQLQSSLFFHEKRDITTLGMQYLFPLIIIHLSSLNQENTSIYVCANATYLSKFRAMVLITSSITMGFDKCPFIPASKDACTSSAKAFAVIAMIGMVCPSGRSSRLRIALVAS